MRVSKKEKDKIKDDIKNMVGLDGFNILPYSTYLKYTRLIESLEQEGYIIQVIIRPDES